MSRIHVLQLQEQTHTDLHIDPQGRPFCSFDGFVQLVGKLQAKGCRVSWELIDAHPSKLNGCNKFPAESDEEGSEDNVA